MIRSRPLHQKIPRRLIVDQAKEARRRVAGNHVLWDQVEVDWSNDLRTWCLRATCYEGKIGHQDLSIVLHSVMGEVEGHRDCEDKRCFLIPLHSGRSTVLWMESEYGIETYRRHLSVGCAYWFNDHWKHGLDNSEKCIAQFLTISRSM